MDVKQLLGAVTAMIARIAIAAVVIIVVFKLAVGAYDFGFQVFADIPVSEGEGRTVNVVITEGQGAKEVGKMLEMKGLISDSKLFYIHEKLSDYKDGIKPGTYELNTAMSIEEMLQCICSNESSTQEAGDTVQDTYTQQNETQETAGETYTDTTEDVQE